ncbi:AMP-dependent synthetase/ligase [Brevibacillus sp. B_LB10_24]|uniref:AMP-dependent synthetase/ligase n=1 Tax=Brevibacillus sp. B_LB10_24 TaxID=3380645 RepID=UPI0038BBC55C
MKKETIPQYLAARAIERPDQVAMRSKTSGIWRQLSWQQLWEQVKALSIGLSQLDFHRGDNLAIIGDNRPEWVVSEMAAQAVGGTVLGIYQDSSPEEIAEMLVHCDVKIVIADGQEQVDKLLEITAELPLMKRIIFCDPRGMRGYSHPLLLPYSELLAQGKQSPLWSTDCFQEMIQDGSAEDIAILCYTAGTTAAPKAAMLSHRNLLTMAESLFSLDRQQAVREYVSFLPLAWIGEQMMGIAGFVLMGYTVNFPEDTATVEADLREIGPDLIFCPPRIWEDITSRIQLRIQGAGWLRRNLYEWFRPYGEAMAQSTRTNVRLPFWQRLMYRLGDYLVFSAMKDHIGLLRTRRAYTSGGMLGTDVCQFFHSLGIELRQVYGQTEVCGMTAAQRKGRIRPETVGEPLSGTEIKISQEGEILVKSPGVFAGYYKDEQATCSAFAEGWFRTGDSGHIDSEGQLTVHGRLQDVIRLSSGETVPAQLVENKLKFSPFIREAIALGTDRPYVTALVNIDMESVGRWASLRQLAYTTYADLTQKPEVLSLILAEVKRINAQVPKTAQVKRFVLLYKELDADDGELTRTKKVRREFVAKKYEEIIRSLYTEDSMLQVEGTVRYRDGRESAVRTQLTVMHVENLCSSSDEEVA